MKYFSECKTLNEVKQLYRQLAKDNHPDHGGDTATMQQINLQYARAINAVASGMNLSEEEFNAEILNAEQYKNAVDAIVSLPGIEIEICGGWIWVTGETKQHKEIFKKAGFFYAFKKVAWYFRSAEYKCKNRRKFTLEQIRDKYGSQKIPGRRFATLGD